MASPSGDREDFFDLRTIYNELSEVKYMWFKIGVQLGVPYHKLKEFEQETDSLAALIDYGLKGNIEGSVFSWNSIVKALKGINSSLAKRIELKYRGSEEDKPCDDSGTTSSQQSVVAVSVTSSGSSSFRLPAVDMARYFPHLSDKGDGRRMTEDELVSFRVELDGQTSKIKRTFASLVFDLKANIEKNCKFDDLVGVLKFLDDKKLAEKLASCTSISQVFDELSKYFSFFDFEIIKLLTKKFGSEFNKKKLEEYRKMFKKFSTQRVCECPKDAFGDGEKSEKKFVIKADKHIKSMRVEEAEKLKYRVSKILKLQLRLLHIDDGCVKLTFRAQNYCELIITEEQKQIFKEVGIISIHYGKKTIYGEGSIEVEHKSLGRGNKTDSGIYSKEADSYSQTMNSNSVAMEKDLYDFRLDMIVSAESKPKELPVLSPLCEAIHNRNLTLVKSLIANEENPMVKDINGNSCLHYTVIFDQFNILKYLIEEVGCPAGITGWHNTTLLHVAAHYKHFSMVQYLVESEMCRLDPTALDQDGHSVMYHACFGGNLDIVSYLIDCITREYMKLEDILHEGSSTLVNPGTSHKTLTNDDFTSNPLCCACYYGHLPVVKYLVEDCRYSPSQAQDDKLVTPVHSAVVGNQLDILKYLIQSGISAPKEPSLVYLAAQMTSKEMKEMVRYLIEELHCDLKCNYSHNTPLHAAAFSGNVELALFLINEYHCDVKIKGNNDRSVLHSACKGGNVNLVRTLICEHGADITARDDRSNTPLHVAAVSGNRDISLLLINDFHCDIQVKGLISGTVLHFACEGGNADLVRTLILEHGTDITARDDENNTPLHVAAESGNKEVALLLINDFHCDITMKGQVGKSVLHSACYGGNADLVCTLILEHGADITARDDLNNTPLHVAAFAGNQEVVLLLINKFNVEVNRNGNVGRSVLHFACEGGNTDLVSTLIFKHGADITARDDQNNTPLHIAAGFGKKEVVLFFIKVVNCDVKMKGQFVLHSACRGGNTDLVRTLILEHGADITARDDRNNTPLHVAADRGNREVALILINEFQSDVKMKGYAGRSVLHSACRGGNVDLVRTLILEHGADITARDDQKDTPLHVAAMCGNKKVTLLLINDFQSDIKMKGPFGKSVLHYACYGGNADLVRTLILEHGADITARDDQNDTPLHVAAFRGHTEVALLLINEFHCDVKVKGLASASALHHAVASGHFELTRTLVRYDCATLANKDKCNCTPLDYALELGHAKVALYLIVACFKYCVYSDEEH